MMRIIFFIGLLLAPISFVTEQKPKDGDQPTVIFYDVSQGIPDNYISCIAEDNKSNIWIRTWDGLFKIGY